MNRVSEVILRYEYSQFYKDLAAKSEQLRINLYLF